MRQRHQTGCSTVIDKQTVQQRESFSVEYIFVLLTLCSTLKFFDFICENTNLLLGHKIQLWATFEIEKLFALALSC